MTSRAARQAFALGVASIALVSCLATPASPVPTIGPSIPPAAAATPASTATPSDLSTPDPSATEPPELPARSLVLAPIVEDLDQPVAVAAPDDGSGDLYVVEQAGRILRLPAGNGPPEVALDIRDRVGSGGERGLLGLAFHPMVADDSRLFVDYTDTQGDTIVAEYRLADGRIRKGSERIVLKVSQPAANHNGGDLHFGPDGMLYISFGDGGGGNSAQRTAPGHAVGEDPAHRRQRPARQGPGLCHPGRQPVRRAGRRTSRDLDHRPAQPVALLDRAGHGRPVDRRRRRRARARRSTMSRRAVWTLAGTGSKAPFATTRQVAAMPT